MSVPKAHSALPDLIHALSQAGVETRTDPVTRLLYSTDASIYQVEPLGVAFPRTTDELSAAVELAMAHQVPVLPRGSGSSLAGQAIGAALILDCARYLNRIIEIDPERRTALVEPGVILNTLNRLAARHGLTFGPDPASAERATLGGSLANNASGAHSILYGMAADHLLEVDVLLSDGSAATFGSVKIDTGGQAEWKGQAPDLAVPPSAERWALRPGVAGGGVRTSRESALYAAALAIRQRYTGTIRARWPRTWRRASGYNLNYLLPWSPAAPPQWSSLTSAPYPPVQEGHINLAPLVVGSEGTLAVIQRATLNLVPLPGCTLLAVLCFNSIAEACDAVPAILEYGPSAVELIPRELVRLARSAPAYAAQTAFVEQASPDGDPAALLVVEFSGPELGALRLQAQGLSGMGLTPPWLAETGAAQRNVWALRKVGLGILMGRAGDTKPWAFIEDLAVPVERLGEFIRGIERLLASYGTHGEIYAHASAGCLHIRPLLNLKSVSGVQHLRQIASDAVTLTLSLGGAVSGEHGDGLARSEWLEAMFGPELIQAFRDLKTAADPHNLLNPGKIVSPTSTPPPPMDANLRLGPDYHATPWQPVMDFSTQAGLDGAIEQCNGAGVCRKSEGVMCPSFQATGEEMHSTRGRANLLRAMISGRFPQGVNAERAVYEALDLCLACKGCKAECPSGVDMARLKYEFTHHYYGQPGHRRKLRDYLFGYIGPLARLGSPFYWLVNPLLGSPIGRAMSERLLGLVQQRAFPQFTPRPLTVQLHKRHKNPGVDTRPSLPVPAGGFRALVGAVPNRPHLALEDVLFLNDAFSEFFHPAAGLAAVQALEAAGCRVHILPVLGAGRTLISKGFVAAAQNHARHLVRAIQHLDPHGQWPVIGVEPSEIYTLRDEYLSLLPDNAYAHALADRAWMVDEFLIRPGPECVTRYRLNVERSNMRRANVLLHGHCYQKARPPAADGYPTGVGATVAMLQAAGYTVETVDSGCCGMAGAFGYEREHYATSLAVGELKLLPAVRAASPATLIAACGVSCQAQIEDNTPRQVKHPVELVL